MAFPCLSFPLWCDLHGGGNSISLEELMQRHTSPMLHTTVATVGGGRWGPSRPSPPRGGGVCRGPCGRESYLEFLVLLEFPLNKGSHLYFVITDM